MTTDAHACETPLLDLLRSVPLDARDLYSHGGPFETRSIPYGRHCHAAAAEIARLQAQVAELQADARRYQHLRNQEAGDFPPKHGSIWVVMYEHPAGTTPSMVSAGYGERLDANVDAALAAGR